jgi:hypothetical protein
VGVLTGYILQFLKPRAKVVFWPAHHFVFNLPKSTPTSTPIIITTHAITVQNVGRRRAENIEVAHSDQPAPQLFHLWPTLQHTVHTQPGVHLITISGLGPGEGFTLEFLDIGGQPSQLLYIRSNDGLAQQILMQPQRVPPKWMLSVGWAVFIAGAAFLAYWIIQAVILISRHIL